MVKHNKTYLISIIFLAFLTLIGCKGEKEVTIKRDYVINPNWNKTDNAFEIYRMNLKDSSDIDLKNVSPSELLKKLEKDTSFSFIANVKYNGEDYSKRKVYFDKNNGFLWHKLTFDTMGIDVESGKNKIGELKKDNWYLLAGLSKISTLHYVYLDSLDSLHIFKIPTSSWTNI
ncbi:MAG: hypothetical protein M3Q97_11730 [Bacteroidota bacterium]|nr:hypothetical protein [Bacteroidota bacterium]